MRNNDSVLLEQAYASIYEMAFGLGRENASAMTIKEIMDLVVQKDSESEKRAIPFSFTSITMPKVYKKSPPEGKEIMPYKTLYKVTQTVAELTDYEKEVNRQLTKQGEEADFQRQGSSVIGERLSRSVGISKKGLPVLILNTTYIKPSTSLFVGRGQDGQLSYVEKEEARKYMYPPSTSPQGTDVKWRNYGFDKLVGLRVDKQEILNSEIDDDKKEVFEFVKDQLKS